MPVSHWCIFLHQWQLWGVLWCYIHIGVGFGVARFDLQGHSQEPQIVKRATVQDFTSFLCLYLYNINLTVAVVLCRVIKG